MLRPNRFLKTVLACLSALSMSIVLSLGTAMSTSLPVQVVQGSPYLELSSYVVPNGQTLTVYGINFCATEGCSAVTIKIGDHVVTSEVIPTPDGRFEAKITVDEIPNQYTVIASQFATDQSAIQARIYLIVSPTEDEETENENLNSPPILSGSSQNQLALLGISGVGEFQPNIRWGGRTLAVAISPADPNVAIAASDTGGMFSSTDGGANWTHIDSFILFPMADVQFAPSNAQIVIATARTTTHIPNQGGIWRSTDGGSTWQKPATANPTCNSRSSAWGIAFLPGTNDVYVGTDCGIAISHDLGANWTHVALNLFNPAVFAISVQSGGTAGSILDVCARGGHQRSTNGGITWTSTGNANGLCSWAHAPTISVSPLEQDVLFAPGKDCSSNPCQVVLFESDDAGGSWTAISPGSKLNRPPLVVTHLSHDGDPNHFDIYYGDGVHLFRQTCTNTGGSGNRCSTTWNSISVNHVDQADVAFSMADNCPRLVSSDGGVDRSTDCGNTWKMAGSGSSGYNALQIYEITGQVHPDHADLYFGTQDNNFWASGDSGVTWPHTCCSEGDMFQIPHSSPDHSGQVLTFADSGGAGSNDQSEAHLSSVHAWNNAPSSLGAPFLIEPGVYFQYGGPPTNAIFLTTDTGASWTSVGNIPSSIGGVNISANERFPLVAGPASDPTIYQTYVKLPGNRVGLMKITGIRSGTASFALADIGLVHIGQAATEFIWRYVFSVDPNDAQHLIAADSGVRQMKVTRNGGLTWTLDPLLTPLVTRFGQFRFGGLDDFGNRSADTQARAIAFDPTNGSRIFVGTQEAGIIMSENGGQTWGWIAGSDKIAYPTSFFIDEVRNTVWVSSYGRGLWTTDAQIPKAIIGGPYSTNEGTEVALDASSSSDPNNSPLTFEWDLNFDSLTFDVDKIGPQVSFDSVGQDGVFPIALRVTNADGDFTLATTTVTVTNVAPTVSLASDAPIGEGSPVTVSGIVTDPGWLDLLTATIDWGDGTPVETISGTLENTRPDATLTFSTSHVYGDNGNFTAQVCGSDDDTTTCTTIALQIDNVNPTAEIDQSGTVLINGVPTFLAHAGDPIDFSGRSTDPGSDDLFLSWDWNDGSPSPDVTTTYLVNPPNADPFPSPSVQPRDVTDTQTHAFAQACLYEIIFSALDDDGGSASDTATVIIAGNASRSRSSGYWQHQFGRQGHTDFDDTTLQCYLAIINNVSTVFSEARDASTIPEAHDVLFLKQNGGSEIEKLDRELMTAWLNFANGAFEYDQMFDPDRDGVSTSFADIMAVAEAVRRAPNSTTSQLREQRNILQQLK